MSSFESSIKGPSQCSPSSIRSAGGFRGRTSERSLIKGTANLIHMIAQTPARLFFCSSLASVLAGPGPFTESPTTDPSTTSAVGYSQSKWVTERVCAKASETLGGRVHVLRIGQLCGDTSAGYWNEKEGWPLLIRTAETTGVLPELDEVGLARISPDTYIGGGRVRCLLRARLLIATYAGVQCG